MRTTQWIATTVGALVIAVLSTAQLVAQTTPQGGPSEGIKVHGHWTLDIKNPDGTPAAHYEFENALNPLEGGRALAELLAGSAGAGHFTIWLDTTPSTACNANFSPCSISELANTLNPGNSSDLAKSVPTTGPNAGKLVLTGSVRIPVSATITRVQTELTTCAGSVAPSSCLSGFGVGFTQKVLQPTVPVLPNQLVDVTVVISFS